MKTNWDLTKFYNSQEDWIKEFELLANKIEDFNQINFEVSIENIKLILDKISELETLIERLYCYQKRIIDLDITNEEARKKASEALQLYSKITSIHIKFEKFINSNSDEVIKLLLSDELISYDRYIRLIMRKNKHIQTDNSITNKINEIRNSYRAILEQLEFNSVTCENKKIELTQNNYSTLMKSEDNQ